MSKIVSFDLFEGEQLKKEGCELVESHNEPYSDRFKAVGRKLLAESGKVSSEDIIAEVGMPSGHPSAVGAAMRSLAAEEKLYVAGYRKAERPSCHAAIIAIWQKKSV